MRRRLFWRGNSAQREDGFKDLASSKNFRELLEGQSAEESEEHFGSVGSRNGTMGDWEATASPVLVLKFRIGGEPETRSVSAAARLRGKFCVFIGEKKNHVAAAWRGGAKQVPVRAPDLGGIAKRAGEHDGLHRSDLKIYWAFLWAGISRV